MTYWPFLGSLLGMALGHAIFGNVAAMLSFLTVAGLYVISFNEELW